MPPREKAGEASVSPLSAPSAEQIEELGQVMLALGATQEEVQGAKEAISADPAEFGVISGQCASQGALPSGSYWVKGPGSILVEGELHAPGAKVELSAALATGLRQQISSTPPVERSELSSRKAGTYRIVGPGAVCVGGEFLTEGTVELTEEEARSIIQVEPVA